MPLFVLQLTAMITMLIDHVGYAFCGNNIIFRVIGRTAFILYAFMLAEGFRHYKDDNKRVFKHVAGLTALTVISEIAFDLVGNHFSLPEFARYQSVMFTLLISLIGLIGIHLSGSNWFYKLSIVVVTLFVAHIGSFDYSACGVLLVYLFYFYQEKFSVRHWFVLAGVFVIYLVLLHYQTYNYENFSNFFGSFTVRERYKYYGHIVPFVLIASYNGKLGYQDAQFKLVYRYFYPVHLFIIYIFMQILHY